MSKVRNPLEPMSTAVKAVLALLAALLGMGVLAGLFVDDVSVLGFGEKSVCVTDTNVSLGVDERPAPPLEPAPGAGFSVVARPQYCTEDPSAVQSLLNSVPQVVPFAFTAGALLLTLRLIRGADDGGPYTARTAERLRRLAWWLLAGSVLAAVATSMAEKALLASLQLHSDVNALSGVLSWDVPYMAILTGLGLLSFSRIMRIGVTMREDLEGTV